MRVVIIDKYKHRYTVMWGIFIFISMIVTVLSWLSVRPADTAVNERLITGVDIFITVVACILFLLAFHVIKPATVNTLWMLPLGQALSLLSKIDSTRLSYNERLGKFGFGNKNNTIYFSPEIKATTVVKSPTLVILQSNAVLYIPIECFGVSVLINNKE